MLKRFEVKNIKNFQKEFVLDFSDVRDYQFNKQCIRNTMLKNIIIYGKNAVGKSNLGLALFDIVGMLTDHNVSFYARKFETAFLNADSSEGYAQFSYTFQLGEYEVQYDYQKEGYNELKKEIFKIDSELIFEIDYQKRKRNLAGIQKIGIDFINQEYIDDSVAFLRYLIKNTLLPEGSPLRQLYGFVSGMQWVRSFEDNQLVPRRNNKGSVTSFLYENELIDDFSNFLAKFGIENKIEVEETRDGRHTLYFKHKKQSIPLFSSASSGTLSLASLYFATHISKEITFLWIDEFDAFYHFELSGQVMEYLIYDNEYQTVCASHNTSLLSNRIMRPDCYFILNENRLVSLPNATDRELREGHNLEKLYQSGEFEDIDEES